MRPLLRPMRCAVFLPSLSIWMGSVGNAATVANHAVCSVHAVLVHLGEFGSECGHYSDPCISEWPCVPADCESEADVIGRHAKSSLM